MFGTVRKHQTVLWSIIIGIIILSFVVFFSPTANMDLGRSDSNFGTIKGKAISRDDFANAYNEVRLFYRLRFGDWPQNEDVLRMRGFDIEQEAYARLLLTKKMQEMNIQVPAEATARWIADLFKRGGAQGGSLADQYSQFVKTQLEPNGITSADFERFARHEVGNQHLVSVFGASGGMISRAEAEAAYKRENENMVAEAVFFNTSNFVSQVKADDEAVKRYFEANRPMYRIPARVQVDFVRFNAADFKQAAEQQFNSDTNAALILERVYFERGGTNAFKDEQGNPQTLEQAKPKLKEEYLKQAALSEARKRAQDFINEVDAFANANAGATNALAQVAAKNKLKAEQSPLFDQSTETPNLPFSLKSAALRLERPGQLNPSPALGEDAAFAFALKRKEESRVPELAEVKDRVVQDFKQSEAAELARKAAEAFQQNASKGLAEKKSFESLLVGNKAQSVTLPPFNLQTRTMPELAGRVPLDRLQNAAMRLSPGQVSELLTTENGAAVIYLRDRKPVDQQKLSSEIEEFIANMREQREYAAYMAWRNKLPEEMDLRRPMPEQPAQQSQVSR